MTGAKDLYPEYCHIFVLAPHRSNWKIILRHCSPAQRGPFPALGPAEQKGIQHGLPHQNYSEIRLQDPTLNRFLGRKRNFSVYWRSVKKCVYAVPSLRTVFDAAHKAYLIPIRQCSKLFQASPAHSSLDLELSMVCATCPVLLFLLTANIWLHAQFLFWHCSVQIIPSYHKIVQVRTSGPSIDPP